jgi:hypothetical protein
MLAGGCLYLIALSAFGLVAIQLFNMDGGSTAARLLGRLAYHTHDSRRSEPGFPDFVLTRRRRTIFAKLKSDTGRLSAPQRRWLAALSQNPVPEVYLWRPAPRFSHNDQRASQAPTERRPRRVPGARRG